MSNTPEQQKAIDTKGKSIIVSAGAGSGKTAVLKQRVGRILKQDYFEDGRKVHITNLIVLTFTKNAAQEMKERIRKIINEDEELKSEAELLDSSYITTFDSFSGSLVKKYNYLLNVSKNFTIIDDSIINTEINNILDEIFESYYAKDDKDFKELISTFCIKNDKQFRKNIIKIYNQMQNKIDKDNYLDNYIDNYFKDDYINLLFDAYETDFFKKRDDVASLFERLNEETNKEDKIQDNITAISNFLNATTYDELKDSLNFRLATATKDLYTDEGKSIKKQISTIVSSLKKNMLASKDELINYYKMTKNYTNTIIKILKELDTKVMEFKNNHNAYSFTDIALMAIDLVRNYPEVKEDMKHNIYEIMVDEYQDTSDIQEEFIQNIQNNNVFMVGDIKQSIYRFRNANPYIFKNKYDSYKDGIKGIKIDLNKNFRSRKEVVNNINLIFDNIMTDDIGGASYKKEHEMVFGNTSFESVKDENYNYNMEILNYKCDDKYPSDKKNVIEAFIIANDIKNKIDNHVKVKDGNNLRDCTYQDFTILIDKSTNFETLKQVLEYKGIPSSIEKDVSIKEDDEIYILDNIINLIIKIHELKTYKYNKIEDSKEKANWWNDFKHYFMSISRSYIFKTSDQELFDIFLNNSYKETKLYKICEELSDNIDSLSNKEILINIIDKFNIVNLLINVGNVKERLTKLEYFINNASSLNDFGMDIYDLSNYFEHILTSDDDIKMGKSNGNSNSVKIMTIHGSKGLEFPFVYVPYLNSNFYSNSNIDNFSFDNTYGLIIPFFDEGIGSTFVKSLTNTHNKLEELSEKIRLLYVALTRPVEKFILINEFNPESDTVDVNYSNLSEATSYASLLELIKDKLNNYIVNLNLDDININFDYNIASSYNYKKSIAIANDTIRNKKLVINSKPLEDKHFSKPLNKVIDKELKETLDFGTYMHYVFETYDFNNPNLDKINITDKAREKINNFLQHDEVKNISKAKIYKEHEIEFESDDSNYHGFIDLLVEYDDHFDIIDYKLSNISSPEYVSQLNGYKEYIESRYNKKANTYLYSINKDIFKKVN